MSDIMSAVMWVSSCLVQEEHYISPFFSLHICPLQVADRLGGSGAVCIQTDSVHSDSTHQSRARASHAVCRFEADQLTLGRPTLLCRVLGCVVGLPQDMVHTAVGSVVVSG